MKQLFVILFGLVLTSAASASTIDCTTVKDGKQLRLIIHVRSLPTTLTVMVNGQTVYSKVPVVQTSPGGGAQLFQSPEFINKHRAPASLSVQVWRDPSGVLNASFGEGSYVWVVPYFQAKCQGF